MTFGLTPRTVRNEHNMHSLYHFFHVKIAEIVITLFFHALA